MKDKDNQKICMIEIPRGGLDNDYTFYKSGKIYHFYDRHTYSGGQNREEWITADNISDSIKDQLLEKCPKEHLEEIKDILYPRST